MLRVNVEHLMAALGALLVFISESSDILKLTTLASIIIALLMVSLRKRFLDRYAIT